MATNNSQKLKLLHLMDILQTETDPDHGLTMPQIIEKLLERGVSAERKTESTNASSASQEATTGRSSSSRTSRWPMPLP